MSPARLQAVELSLNDGWGIPYPAGLIRPRHLRRVGAAVAAVTALVVAVAATAASLAGYADAGVVPSLDGTTITSVSATGFAWRAGVRPGQHVVATPDPSATAGWRLVTEADGRTYDARASDYDAALRDALPLGLLGMVAGGLAIVFLRAHRRWVAAAACLSLAASAPGLELLGRPDTSTFAMAAAAVAPAVWLAWRPRLPVAASLLASLAIGAAIVIWAAARLWAMPGYDRLESIRVIAAFWLVAAVVTASIALPILREGRVSASRPRIADVLLVGVAAGLSLGLIGVASVSPVAVGALLLAAILVIPAWRRWLAAGAERAILSDLRERAALAATESERANLARELHDVPLQGLSGVIRRLDVIPEARAEADSLRAVAEQLRGLATVLRPPVLDDLGLGPALEFLGETTTTPGLPVRVEVDDRAGPDASSRPPAEVELAAFRIAQEAVANAIRHAAASEVRLEARVEPDEVALSISDDGHGLSEAVAAAAGRHGRLGLASIRRRAEAIDAELSITGSDAGTRIRLRWQR